MPDPLADLAAPFRPFLDRLRPGPTVAVLCHCDADGLAAGAILTRALRRAGLAAEPEVTGKGESAWSPEVAGRLAARAPQALIVADLGCRAAPVLDGAPTAFLDHRRPDGVPGGATLVTGYGADPAPTSGLLAFACASLAADVSDFDWVAAISLLGDIGDKAPFDRLASAKKRHTAARLKEATALVNAPRRSASGDARPALELLLRADGPRDITHGDSPEADAPRAAMAEMAEEFTRVKRTAPRGRGEVALILFHSPCQVHPLVAQTWRSRLAGQAVIAANKGYLPGRVNFSARTAGAA